MVISGWEHKVLEFLNGAHRKARKILITVSITIQGCAATLITKITVDRKGYVWVATSASEVYVIDPSIEKVMLHFGTEEHPERKLTWNGTASVFQYDDTTMVIAAKRYILVQHPPAEDFKLY
jgi:hypothetical protein